MLKELFSAEFKQKLKRNSVVYSWASTRNPWKLIHHVFSAIVLIIIEMYLFFFGVFYVLSIRSNFDLWFTGFHDDNGFFYLFFVGVNLFIFVYMILVFGGLLFLIKTNMERLNHSNLILRKDYLELIVLEYETQKKKKNSITQSIFKLINLGLYQSYKVSYREAAELDDFLSLRNSKLTFRLEDTRVEIGRALTFESKQLLFREIQAHLRQLLKD